MNIKKALFIKSGFLLSFLFLFSSSYGQEKKKLTAAQFLQVVRTPPRQKTWAQLTGKAVNMKKNKKGKRIITESPIYLGVRFTSEMIFAQIVMGKDEIYSVGQPYSVIEGISVIDNGKQKQKVLKADFGIKPEDLTMSFIFWNLIRELEGDSACGQTCRVFLLRSPDKKESAKVYISEQYYFPLKVEWSKPEGEKEFDNDKILRTLRVDAFKEVNDLYIVDSLIFFGPGWRTKVEFSDTKAGYVKDGPPKDLFKE